jgi:hypothetical protein
VKLEGLNDQIMAMAAYKYCLGRQSYVGAVCVEWLRATWPQMEKNTQNAILSDTLELLVIRGTGDVRAWSWPAAAAWMWQQMDAEQRDWIVKQTRHLDDVLGFLEPKAEAERIA